MLFLPAGLFLSDDRLSIAVVGDVADGKPHVPNEVSNLQARAVLMQMPGSAEGRTLFDDVDDTLRAQGGVFSSAVAHPQGHDVGSHAVHGPEFKHAPRDMNER